MNVTLAPVGTAWQRRANLSSYLVGCPNTLANVIKQDMLNRRDHLFRVGNYEYLAFANTEDRRRYVLAKLQKDAHRFLPLGFLADTIMVDQYRVLNAVSGDLTNDQRRREINRLVETSGSWTVLYNATVERFGYQIILGGLDQMGCPWIESDTNPQLVFRIASNSIDYDVDEKRNTAPLPLDKKDQMR